MTNNLLKMYQAYGFTPEVLASVQKEHKKIENPVAAYGAFVWMNLDSASHEAQINQPISASPENARTATAQHFIGAPTPAVV